MTKLQFLFSLREKLSDLPPNEVEERLKFFSEMIEDRMEEGLTEEEAVRAVGSADQIAAQIISEAPTKSEPAPQKKTSPVQILLLILGFPLWFPLLVALAAVAISLYVVLWSVLISFWAVFVSVVACAIGVGIAGIFFAVTGNALPGLAVIGAAIFCAGLSIFLFWGCKAATKGTVHLTRKLIQGTVARSTKRR